MKSTRKALASPLAPDNRAKRDRELIASWETIKDKWAKVPRRAFGNLPVDNVAKDAIVEGYTQRGKSDRLPSRVTTGGSTAPKNTTVYTGTMLVGISPLHKSNLVPIFSKEDAVDIARMRR